VKRFLVVELYTIQVNGILQQHEEPCQDFDTIEDAEAWIAAQEEPEIYEIEDQLADDLYDEDDLLDDDYRDNDDEDYVLHEDREDFHSDDGFGFDDD
jgi:hypothetical protein